MGIPKKYKHKSAALCQGHELRITSGPLVSAGQNSTNRDLIMEIPSHTVPLTSFYHDGDRKSAAVHLEAMMTIFFVREIKLKRDNFILISN